MNVWRETWRGHDQCDGATQVEVEAETAAEARRKGESRVLNPGKGKAWSHSRWATDVVALAK